MIQNSPAGMETKIDRPIPNPFPEWTGLLRVDSQECMAEYGLFWQDLTPIHFLEGRGCYDRINMVKWLRWAQSILKNTDVLLSQGNGKEVCFLNRPKGGG